MQRQVFEVSTDTGRWSRAGSPVSGGLVQMRWVPSTADTGADLKVTLLPRTDDTGDNDCLGAQFTKVPTQASHQEDGRDTGSDQQALVGFAGDRPRVEVTPGGAAVAGRLYLWFTNE
jgi:hypothetical protein